MWQVIIQTKQPYLEALSAVIEDHCVTTSWVEIEDPKADWDSEDWFVEGHMLEEPNEKDLRMQILLAAKTLGIEEPLITIQPLMENNWLEEMWEKFPPQDVGPFFIHSSHFKGDIPTNKIPLILDAATAFGSGEHGTTSGCMLALSDLLDEFKWENPLDLGCGSGILAIAACKLNPVKTLAIDNDTEAVRVTMSNAALNNISPLIEARLGEGLDKTIETFDLIIANILAKPLIHLAPAMHQHLAPHGYVILSGLLDWQQEDVEKAYLEQGFSLHRLYDRNRWITLVLKNSQS